jgi:hypothetical protein
LRQATYDFHHIFSPHVLKLLEKIRHQVISALKFFYEAFLEMAHVKKNSFVQPLFLHHPKH